MGSRPPETHIKKRVVCGYPPFADRDPLFIEGVVAFLL